MSAKAGYSLGVFQSSAWHYGLGRIANAVMSVGIFLLLARGLDASDYAAYVVAIAMVEVLLVASVLGMDWVTAVQIPKLRMAGAGRLLGRLVAAAVAVQALLLAVLGALMFVFAAPASAALGHAGHGGVFELYAVVLIIEGCSRMLRDQILTSLLMQGVSQLAQALRNGGLLVYLALVALGGSSLDLLAFARMEIVACAASLGFGAVFLLIRLRREHAADAGGTAPLLDLGAVRSMALSAWLASLTGLLWSGQIVVLVASRLLGPEVAGLVGFARNLAEQVRRLMPAEFLFNLLRPVLSARFAADRSAQGLLARSALVLKLNLLCVLPALLLAVVHGDLVCDWVSGGRYAEAHWVLVGWLAWVLVWSFHRLADNTAHLLGHSKIVGRTGLAMLLAPPLYLAAAGAAGVQGLLIALVLAEAVYVGTVWRKAMPGGLGDFPWQVFRPMRLLALLACVLAAAALLGSQAGWVSALVMGITYLTAAGLLRLASPADLRDVVAEAPQHGGPGGLMVPS